MTEPITLFAPMPPEPELEAFFAAHAEAIRVLARRTARDIVEIGHRLIVVKEKKDYGEWLSWLKAEFGWTNRTAENYMNVADAFKGRIESLSNLQINLEALYLLARDEFADVRDTVIEHASQDERITKAKAAELIEAAREEARAEANIDQRKVIELAVAEYRERQAPLLETAIREATSRLTDNNQALADEIERLKGTRQTPDVAAIAEMIRLALQSKAKRLTDAQYVLLAQILGHSIAVGRKRYEPVSQEMVQQNLEMLRITSRISEALEALAGAPPPADVIAVAYPSQLSMHRRLCPPLVEWLNQYVQLLGED